MTRKTVFEVLKNSAGRWYWHERSSNGKIVDVAQAYSRKSGAVHAARIKASRTANAVVKVLA